MYNKRKTREHRFDECERNKDNIKQQCKDMKIEVDIDALLNRKKDLANVLNLIKFI